MKTKKYQSDPDLPFEIKFRILFENQDIVRRLAKVSDIFVTVDSKSYLMKPDGLHELTNEQHLKVENSRIISVEL